MRFANTKNGAKRKEKAMDKYIRIMYFENGELKKILKEVDSVDEATEEINKTVVLEFPITEFSFYHN